MADQYQAFSAWIRRIEAVTKSLRDHYDSLLAAHSDWEVGPDARLAVFSKPENVLNSIALAMDYESNALFNAQWWGKRHPGITRKDAQRLAGQFDVLMKMCLVNFLYCAFESSFRLYVRAIDANACGQGRGNFKPIYDWLFKRLSCRQWTSLVDFWRLIRNTVHNNGVYWHPGSKEEEVAFEGRKYSFRNGQPVECTWEAAVRMAELLPDMLQDVTTAPELIAIPQIIDPAGQEMGSEGP